MLYAICTVLKVAQLHRPSFMVFSDFGMRSTVLTQEKIFGHFFVSAGNDVSTHIYAYMHECERYFARFEKIIFQHFLWYLGSREISSCRHGAGAASSPHDCIYNYTLLPHAGGCVGKYSRRSVQNPKLFFAVFISF